MKKDETKRRLLESTLRLFSEKGYLGATTREIAQGAGVTELTLFRHFGTKEKLFEELLRNYSFLPTLRDLLPELDGLTYEEALRLIAARFLSSLKERKSMVKILYTESAVYPDKIRLLFNQYLRDLRVTLAVYFGSMQQKGLLRDISAEMAARMFLGMLFAYFRTEEILNEKGMTKKKMDRDVGAFIDIFVLGTMRSA